MSYGNHKRGLWACCGALALSGAASAAVPRIADVAVAENPDQTLTVSYTLSGAPAIVTLDLVTNAVDGASASIGGANLWELHGDVGRLVGLGHDFATPYAGTIRWVPYRTALKDVDLAALSVRAKVTAWTTNDPPAYAVVRLNREESDAWTNRTYYTSRGAGLRFYPSADYLPGGLLENDAYRTDFLVMKRVYAAGVAWVMGSSANAPNRKADEVPHLVTFSRDYYLGVFEMTIRQRQHLRGLHAQGYDFAGYPDFGEKVVAPCNNLSYNTLRGSTATDDVSNEPLPGTDLYLLRAKTGIAFDLPTEAEWEFACRAGLEGPPNADVDWSQAGVDPIEWNTHNATTVIDGVATRVVHRVGTKAPNAWGFYDMLGNVWETVRDLYLPEADFAATFGGKGYAEPVVDPAVLVAPGATQRGRRGGGVNEAWQSNRSSYRGAGMKPTDSWCGYRVRCDASF